MRSSAKNPGGDGAPGGSFRGAYLAGTAEEEFPASPACALGIRAFEGELQGERGLLPDAEGRVRTVTVTQAILQAVGERHSLAVSAVA